MNERTTASWAAVPWPPVPASRTHGPGSRRGWRRWIDDRISAKGPEPAPPWRVEGMRDGDRNAPGGRGWFWWALLAALLVNWFISSVALAPPDRAEVSYTFFMEQVDAGNVAEITTTADTIEGTFEEEVPYAPGEVSGTPTR